MNFAEKLDLLFPEDTVSIYYADEGKRRRERFIPGPRGKGRRRFCFSATRKRPG